MKIYFSASIAGGRKYLDVYKIIVNYLKTTDHVVFTEHIVRDDIEKFEKEISARATYERDIKYLHECDIVIAEVSNPSLGVGYEICYAENLKKPILCLYLKSLNVSRMILGIKSHSVILNCYKNIDEMLELIDKFIKKFSS